MNPLPVPRSEARVVVVTKAGCTLCVEALAVVESVCAAEGATWEQVDAAEHPELADAYYYEIPVVFVDGSRHDYHRVDPRRLTAALRG